jgi:hypothetical protein
VRRQWRVEAERRRVALASSSPPQHVRCARCCARSCSDNRCAVRCHGVFLEPAKKQTLYVYYFIFYYNRVSRPPRGNGVAHATPDN